MRARSAPRAPSAKPIICLGCALWDTILRVDHIPSDGGKIFPHQAVQAASGMAPAAAVSIARLGAPVSLWARIGADATGAMLVDDLRHRGVAVDGIRQVVGGRTPFSTILVDRRGERLVVPYIDPSLDADPGWLPLHEIAGAGAVLCDMRWVQGAQVAFSEARRCGVPTVLDADVAPVADLWALMPLADHVLFSEPALHSLVGQATPEQALSMIAEQLDAQVIGVTLGAQGALIWQRGGEGGKLSRFAAPSIQAVDTLNAGDVWHGTYAYGLVHGWTLASTVRAANVAAALKCEVFGGHAGAPGLEQVLARLGAGEGAVTPPAAARAG
ncbi:MAG: PfkB family carbohydrate kinase [Pseudomonas sp.]|uniref:PfkB family carbohydrate kinase n=1 Tax=Pseudomonas abieticivorans TaxID=2931382 RepID=UPI0023891B11|nr:PfkB family carbohydrate kinase [Pseudomonas sp. PIA16]MDE1164874.1 PfkB family carbohydrate kinase [Pseudomonas sp.]